MARTEAIVSQRYDGQAGAEAGRSNGVAAVVPTIHSSYKQDSPHTQAHLSRWAWGKSTNVSRRVLIICCIAAMTKSSSQGITCELRDSIKSYNVVTICRDAGTVVRSAIWLDSKTRIKTLLIHLIVAAHVGGYDQMGYFDTGSDMLVRD